MQETKEKVSYKELATSEMRAYGITNPVHHQEWFRRFDYKEVNDVFHRANSARWASWLRLEQGSADATIKQVLGLTKPGSESQVKNEIALLSLYPKTEIEFYKALSDFVEKNPNLFNQGERLDAYKRTWR